MTTKKKILLILSVLFVGFLLIILLTILASLDISSKELGPSPFKIKEELALEENQEFYELVKIGFSIKGIEEFNNNFNYSQNELQLSLFTLQEYLEENDGLIKKAPLDMFKKCILPKPKDSIDPSEPALVKLLSLINHSVTFHILSNNFEKTKSELILINEINNELIKKSIQFSYSMGVLTSKKMELDNIKLLINHPQFSLEQKLEILAITQETITSQFLINHLYFDSILFQQALIDISNMKSKRPIRLSGYPNLPIIHEYLYKPNKATRYYRKNGLKMIDLIENSSFKSISKLKENDHQNFNYFQLLKANSFGKICADQSFYSLKILSVKALSINNDYNQLYVAQQILLYKQKFKQLPPDLNVLNLDKKKSIDLHSGTPFLYYPPNGILYGTRYHRDPRQPRLINQDLPDEEILNIIKENHDGKEFIFYLK